MRYYDFYESPHGQMLLVASDDALTGVSHGFESSMLRLGVNYRF